MSTTGPMEPAHLAHPAGQPGGTPMPISDASPSGGKRKLTSIVILVIAALALIAATTVALTVFGGSSAEASVILHPLGSSGEDPFGPSIAPPPSATLADYAENGAGLTARTTGATLSDYRSVSGDVPGVFGGSLNERACDVDQLVGFLLADPEKAQAWATALGIDPANIGTYADTLTAANLAADTRVLENGFADGNLRPREAILQRGWAVLVDARGVPRVDCYSGNPLRNPTIQPDETYVGTPWPRFAETEVVVVEPAPADITEFVLVDVADGDQFVRPTGSTGEVDTAGPTASAGQPADESDESAPAENAPAPPPTLAPVTRDLNVVGVFDVNSGIRGEVTAEENELIYEFDAAPGAKLTLTVANDRASVGRVAIELQRAGASLNFFRVEAGGSETFDLTLDHESGDRYEIIVSEGPGAFEFVVESQIQDDAGENRDAGADFADALQIDAGQQVAGHLAGLDVSDAYVIELSDAPALVMTARAARDGSRAAFDLQILGERINFFRVNPADEDTYELLFGPDDDGLLELLVAEGPSDYEFVIELVPQNDGGSGGDASAELADALVVESPDDIAGEVGERDLADYYLFEAPADDFTITVDVSPSADGRIAVDLLSPAGVRVDFFRVAAGASGSTTISAEGTEGETYRIIFSEGRGEYAVSVDS